MKFREKEKLITLECVHYLEFNKVPLIPRDGLQKEAEFKQLGAGATKRFETSYNGKAMIGD